MDHHILSKHRSKKKGKHFLKNVKKFINLDKSSHSFEKWPYKGENKKFSEKFKKTHETWFILHIFHKRKCFIGKKWKIFQKNSRILIHFTFFFLKRCFIGKENVNISMNIQENSWTFIDCRVFFKTSALYAKDEYKIFKANSRKLKKIDSLSHIFQKKYFIGKKNVKILMKFEKHSWIFFKKSVIEAKIKRKRF